MCGIAGLATTLPSGIDRQELASMARKLTNRGPDGHGFLCWDGHHPAHSGTTLDQTGTSPASVGLAHRRLAIIDLSAAAGQPMSTPDGQCHIVFNGEIYNYLELREELAASGSLFRTRSDTEVLLAGYHRYGAAFLSRLVGMFALAILDQRRRTLFLARDPFGIKPLYYTRPREEGLAFASTITPLLDLPGVERRVHGPALYRYLIAGITDDDPTTLFAGIQQLPPAHYLEIPLAGATASPLKLPPPERYYALPARGSLPHPATPKAAAELLRETFLDSIRLHLQSDVPIGAALSGGIDSSAIVAGMRHHFPGDLHTLTFVASEPALCEESWADIAGRHSGAIMHKIHLAPADLATDLDPLILAQELPFGSTSIYAQHRIFRRARELGIKVMLDGQGADEMLGGYKAYLSARAASCLRQGQGITAFKLLGGSGEGVMRPLARLVAAHLPDPLYQGALHWRLRHRFPTIHHAWFDERGITAHQALRVLRPQRCLGDALTTAFTELSLPMLLRYEDRNAMAYGVESRVPFLTPALANLVFSLPEAWIIDHQGVTKAIFRQAMRGLVPDPILDRRDKIGFATPEKQWLAVLRPWVDRLINSETAHALPVLTPQVWQNECRAILDGQRPFDWRLWRLLNLVRWTELFAMRYD